MVTLEESVELASIEMFASSGGVVSSSTSRIPPVSDCYAKISTKPSCSTSRRTLPENFPVPSV
jgi:hypothetical protein